MKANIPKTMTKLEKN